MRNACSSDADPKEPIGVSAEPAQVELIFNPACSKSRAAAELLAARGAAFEARDYLARPLDPDELRALVQALGLPARELVRLDDAGGDALPADPDDESAWVALLAAQPRLLQRPILRCGARAVIARPPERMLELLVPSA